MVASCSGAAIVKVLHFAQAVDVRAHAGKLGKHLASLIIELRLIRGPASGCSGESREEVQYVRAGDFEAASNNRRLGPWIGAVIKRRAHRRLDIILAVALIEDSLQRSYRLCLRVVVH